MSTRSDAALRSDDTRLPVRNRMLREQLAAFEPADGDEAAHLERMQRLVGAGGDPFDRHHFDPGHFTASAFVVSRDRRQLLLILHGKLGLWLQPGGHIDPADASIEAAARREVTEETGLRELTALVDGPFDLDVHPIPPHGDSPAHVHLDVRFLFEASVADAVAGSDAKDARLFELDRIDEVASDRSVMRAVEKLKHLL